MCSGHWYSFPRRGNTSLVYTSLTFEGTPYGSKTVLQGSNNPSSVLSLYIW